MIAPTNSPIINVTIDFFMVIAPFVDTNISGKNNAYVKADGKIYYKYEHEFSEIMFFVFQYIKDIRRNDRETAKNRR